MPLFTILKKMFFQHLKAYDLRKLLVNTMWN